jgi:translocation and assembly module TamB
MTLLLRAGLVSGGIILVGAIAGLWYLQQFIQQQLSPLVAKSLSEILNRPVEVGAVEQVSFNRITFGASALPATRTDADSAKLAAIEATFNPLELLWNDRTLQLDLRLVQPDIYIDQEKDGRWIKTEIQEQEPGPIEIKVNRITVSEGEVTLATYGLRQTESEDQPEQANRPQQRPLKQTIVRIQDVNGTSFVRRSEEQFSFDLTGNPESGGNLRFAGDLNQQTDTTILRIAGQNLLGPQVGLFVPLPLQIEAGRASGNVAMQFATEDQPFQINGTVRFRDATGQIAALPQSFNRVSGGLRFQGQQTILQDVRGRYGDIPAQVSGTIDPQKGYNLRAEAPSVSVDNLLRTFDFTSPIPLKGQFRSEVKVTGAIDSPTLNGVARSLRLAQVDRLTLSTSQAEFQITPQAITFDNIRAVPTSGGVVTGRGQISFGQGDQDNPDNQGRQGGLAFDIQAEGLAGDAIARTYGANLTNFRVGRVNGTARVSGSFDQLQTVAQWQAPQATYPGRGRVRIGQETIRFDDTVLLVRGGMVRGQGEMAQGRWRANANLSGLPLNQFSPELRGVLGGNFQLAGRLDNFSARAISATGKLRFSEGIALINQPLDASVKWLGDRIQVLEATAPGFNANGFVFAQLEGDNAGSITNLDLNARLQDYEIAALPIPLPETVQLTGTANFEGKITGNPAAVNVDGRLALNQAAANLLAFEPLLTGRLNYRLNRQLDLDVAGERDRIALRLDGQNRPQTFLVQQGDTIARGEGKGDRLLAELENFPLSVLNFAPASQYGIGVISGRLNGNFDINLADLTNPTILGDVAIAQPSLGYITANQFTGKFRYGGGAAVLEQGELRGANSLYRISGSFNPNAANAFRGQISADQGRIEDILAALQWFDLTDIGRGFSPPTYGSAINLQPVPVGSSKVSLFDQLRRFSEIVALRNQQIAAREEASFLPDLERLRGSFSGNVDLAYSTNAGLSVDFGLQGQDWNWGDYVIKQVVADGQLENGILTLLPLRLESDQSLLTFSGSLGGEQQFGQLRAENVPASALRQLLRLPVEVMGNVNANASLAGSVGNPSVTGEIALVDGQVNKIDVPELRTLFGYNNARLNFNGNIQGDTAKTFQLAGSVPYKFPFMKASPDNDALSLDIDVRNDGLQLLSLFTDQVNWEGGQGEVQLQVRGTLRTLADGRIDLRPTATGLAQFENARFSSKSLPEEISNVAGTIAFENDRIKVQTLRGEFSNGKLVAQGVLPILLPLSGQDPDTKTPLRLALNNLGLELDGVYNGDVDGEVQITGSALAPLVGGEVTLSQGRILLSNTAQPSPTPAPTATAATAPGIVTPPRFDNLLLRLGDGLRVTLDPILSFDARGDLTINGALSNLRPAGTISLEEGQVNLFAAQFNLAGGYDSKAVFEPRRGLDPFLDVRLVTSVPEVTRFPVPSNSVFGASEIADNNVSDFGELQTVRVQANISGLASQLTNSLELTSSPRRTESEIVALIGGSFINSFSQDGNPTLALASVAGSTLLSNLQNLVNQNLGFTDFRLFPTTLISDPQEDARNRTSTLALAGELGIDLTDGLSVSLLQILTTQEPTQFSLRYRLNERFQVRGTTNFDGDSRAILEFDTRF